MSKPLHILISGGGIAGGVFASCLLRTLPTAQIKIVERAPQLRLTGASVDIRNAAVDIIKRMGVETIIRQHATGEAGISFVDKTGKSIATFGATGRTDVQSMTGEYEIFRGALAKIFLDPILDRVDLVCGEYITNYTQDSSGVHVTYSNPNSESTSNEKPESFDLLIAADGLNSKLRGIMLNSSPRDQIHDEGVYAAYFTIDHDLLQGSSTAKWRNLSRGRVIFLRPDPSGVTRAMLMVIVPRSDRSRREFFTENLRQGPDEYKLLMKEIFADGDWLASEVLAGMETSRDFYCSPFAQVKCEKLIDRRVALLGDAGYATPAIGTSLAVIGGYVLAGEIGKTPENIQSALERYEKFMMGFVKTQQSDDNAMQYLNPQSEWGIKVRDALIWSVTRTKLDQLVMRVAGYFDKPVNLPEYKWLEEEVVDEKIEKA